ncbi:hypothetical protein BDZ45DRAFT_691605 [Acephala macrosclerotiorum]|nr:hypothetical protein BDZ45DRAFT_691605 [Acephala macrosclerotiorum]
MIDASFKYCFEKTWHCQVLGLWYKLRSWELVSDKNHLVKIEGLHLILSKAVVANERKREVRKQCIWCCDFPTLFSHEAASTSDLDIENGTCTPLNYTSNVSNLKQKYKQNIIAGHEMSSKELLFAQSFDFKTSTSSVSTHQAFQIQEEIIPQYFSSGYRFIRTPTKLGTHGCAHPAQTCNSTPKLPHIFTPPCTTDFRHKPPYSSKLC